MTTLYRKQQIDAKVWYGTSVKIPTIGSNNFFRFTTSCVGIVNTLVERKLDRLIKVSVSNSIDTAYADQDSWEIVISEKFFSGDFSGIGAQIHFNNVQTIGAILGVIVHEVGHFAYSPKTLLPFIDAVQHLANKQFNHNMARDLANILEDIYIENRIVRLFPTLAWSLDTYNRYIVSQERYDRSQYDLRSVDSILTTERARPNKLETRLDALLKSSVTLANKSAFMIF